MLDYTFVLNQAFKSNDINEYVLTLFNQVIQNDAKVVIELGAGQSTFAFTAGVNVTKGKFYSIDMGGKEATLRFCPNWEGILDKEGRLEFIQGDDMEIVKTWDKEADILFIDTSHTYEHTKAELEAWPKFVKVGGQLIMHDTAHKEGVGVGCRKALDEFLEKHKGEYSIIHLLDTKHIGLSILNKLK